MEREERQGREAAKATVEELRRAQDETQRLVKQFMERLEKEDPVWKPSIDPKISIGHLLSALLAIGSMMVVWGSASAKLDECARQTSKLEATMQVHTEQLSAIRAEQARVAEHLKMRPNDRGQ